MLCVRGVMNVVFSVCIVTRGFCRCSCMGSISVSSCRCCMFEFCVHHVAVLNAVFCMTCSLLMLVEDEWRSHGRGIIQSRSHDCLVGSHKCLFLFTPSCECFYYL